MFKKLTIVAFTSAILSLPAYAVTQNGIYLGLQGGESNANYSDDSLSSDFDLAGANSSSVDNTSWAARIYGGYQFNKYIAAELGYSYLGQVDFNNIDGLNNADAQLLQQGIDLTAKIMLPITSKFSVFALLGGDYMIVSADSSSSSVIQASGNQTGWGVTYGLGAEYDFNPKWGIDATWRRFDANNGIQDTDLFTLGIAWHI